MRKHEHKLWNIGLNLRYLVFILSFCIWVSGCSSGGFDFGALDDAERTAYEHDQHSLVAFMPLDYMFPDKKVRALARAAGDGDINEIDALVKQGVDVNAKGSKNATPLFWAMHDYQGFVRLLELGADPNAVFDDGTSIMNWCAEHENVRFLKAALAHGGNPNLTAGPYHETPLLRVMGPTRKDRASLLLDSGADINKKGGVGNDTPIMVAANLGQFDLVYQLLNRGADITIKNRNGWDLLDVLAENKRMTDPTNNSQIYKEITSWLEKDISWLKQRGINLPKELPKPKNK